MSRRTKVALLVNLFFAIMLDGYAQIAHPAWSAQSNIYEVNLRQYSASGSFKDFAKHLPTLAVIML